MKNRINKLVKSSRAISLSRAHSEILMDMSESCGAVNITSPKKGSPNLSILLEAIAEGRLHLYDPDQGEVISPDEIMLKDLNEKLEKDRKENPMRKMSPLMRPKSAVRIQRSYES